jgi:putative intracellular protease/amidase
MVKKIVWVASCLVLGVLVLGAAGAYWVSLFSFDEAEIARMQSTQVDEIAYLEQAPPAPRGKILAVVTSVRELGNTGRPTGYELTELARAYWVFTANGFEVDIASPDGGEPYALLDDDDMGIYDYAFLNDEKAQRKARNTLRLSDVNASDYHALYFVGGKGAMFDFPDNPAIQKLVEQHFAQNKLIVAVCHGPAALVNARTADGHWFVGGKALTAFTDDEELLLIPNAEQLFPFLLQKQLQARGADFFAGPDYLENVVVEEGLITGQNPWSVWRMAEEAVRQLGVEPVPRKLTPEERSADLLMTFRLNGLEKAERTVDASDQHYHAHLVLMHSLVAYMKWELMDGIQLMILADRVRAKNGLY